MHELVTAQQVRALAVVDHKWRVNSFKRPVVAVLATAIEQLQLAQVRIGATIG